MRGGAGLPGLGAPSIIVGASEPSASTMVGESEGLPPGTSTIVGESEEGTLVF